MNKKLKIFLTFFLFVASVFFFPFIALAADKWIPPTLQISIPTLTGFSAPEKCDTAPDGQPIYCVGWIGEYIGAIYKYAIGIIGIVAAIALMIGGARWLTAGGNPSAVKDAQSWITGAITGLIIGLASYLILYQINPNLVIFKPIRVKMVKEVAISSVNDRLINCSIKSASECAIGSNGMKTDDSWNKCAKPTCAPDDIGCLSQVCCCFESPLPNCQWETDCSAGREPADGAGCGTFYGGLAEKCCCSKATGGCNPAETGACSPKLLQANGGNCFGSNINEASAICQKESSGNETNTNPQAKCSYNGNKYPVVIGLFQINISANIVRDSSGNSYNCRSAFDKPYSDKSPNCNINNWGLYDQCKKLMESAANNIATACSLSNNGSNWGKWVANDNCKY
ncbi:MAG: hypothetical protein WCW25_01115 [Patescibacteria group bacterium]|jgi:hypothetical protein